MTRRPTDSAGIDRAGDSPEWVEDLQQVKDLSEIPAAIGPAAPCEPVTRVWAYSPRYRCPRGHVSRRRLSFWLDGVEGGCVHCCQRCYAEMLARECGGLEELPPEAP